MLWPKLHEKSFFIPRFIPGRLCTSLPLGVGCQNTQIFWKYPHPICQSPLTPAKGSYMQFKTALDFVIITADKVHVHHGDFSLLVLLGVRAHLGQQIFPVSADAKAWDAGSCDTGAVWGFLHSTDLRHGLLFLLLLLGWGGHNLHIMLLLCNTSSFL